jgi:hypothetical protein
MITCFGLLVQLLGVELFVQAASGLHGLGTAVTMGKKKFYPAAYWCRFCAFGAALLAGGLLGQMVVCIFSGRLICLSIYVPHNHRKI